MTPEDTLKKTTAFFKNLEKAKRLSVVVGLPKETASGKIYPAGIPVLDIGSIHEFGAGDNPQRSFLRVPFSVRKKEIAKVFRKLFNEVAEKGADAETQLEKAGVFLQNISKQAFENDGYGTWKDIKPATKKAKGSSAVLIDKGILRGSITYEVRGS